MTFRIEPEDPREAACTRLSACMVRDKETQICNNGYCPVSVKVELLYFATCYLISSVYECTVVEDDE